MTIPSDIQKWLLVKLAGEEMLSRLKLFTLKPEVILYAGAPHADIQTSLNALYPDAILHLSTGHEDSFKQTDYSVDLLIANLCLPWAENKIAFLKEAARVLKKGGVIFLSSLGVDTLRELRLLDPRLTTPLRLDLHELGDDLAGLKFQDPVMEVDHWVLSYQSQEKLKEELLAMNLCLPEELNALDLPESVRDITIELVFGHAFAAGKLNTFSPDESGVVKVPISGLR